MIDYIVKNAGRNKSEQSAVLRLCASMATGWRPDEPASYVTLDQPIKITLAELLETNLSAVAYPLRVQTGTEEHPDKPGQLRPIMAELTEAAALRYGITATKAVRHGCQRSLAAAILAAVGVDCKPVLIPCTDDPGDGVTAAGLRRNLEPVSQRPDKGAVLEVALRHWEGRERDLLAVFGGLPGERRNTQQYAAYCRLAKLPGANIAEILELDKEAARELAARPEASYTARKAAVEKLAEIAKADAARKAGDIGQIRARIHATAAALTVAELVAVIDALAAGADETKLAELAGLCGAAPELANPPPPPPPPLPAGDGDPDSRHNLSAAEAETKRKAKK